MRCSVPLVTLLSYVRKQLIAGDGDGLGSGGRRPHGPWRDAEEETALNPISNKYGGDCDASALTLFLHPPPSLHACPLCEWDAAAPGVHSRYVSVVHVVGVRR